MAGLYIHIPFCRDACNYCDFHFSIDLENLSPMLKAIEKEIVDNKEYLEGEELATIYLGGGTPSVLKPSEIGELLKIIQDNYEIDKRAEITLEANPDDINSAYLSSLKKLGINRLSIGIQSFDDEDLKLMNRIHDSGQSKTCLDLAKKEGFDNLNIDLIYGIPGMNNNQWKANLETAFEFEPPHISAYHLSYETGTVLDYRRHKAKVQPVDENRSLDHYNVLTEKMELKGYQQYEVSNFALTGSISKHNSAYWKGEKYLGVGPSAHSYNGQTRRWNMSKNSSYIRGIFSGNKIYEEEILDKVSLLHDYLITSLRTMWGADLKYVKNEWGSEYFEHVMIKAEQYIKAGKILHVEGKLILTSEGMFIADHIIRELFI